MQEQLEAVRVAVLRAEVARGVAVTVLSIDVGTLMQQGLDDREVASDAGDMERSAHRLGPAVDIAPVPVENIDQLDVALIRGHMQRGPTVTVALVEQGRGELEVLADQYLVAGTVVTFFCGNPNVSEELLLVSALLLLEQLRLADAFLCSCG